MKICILCFIILLCLSFNFVSASERYLCDSNSGNKFSIIIPDGWKANGSKQNSLLLTLVGPTDKSFTIKINIMIDKTENMTLDDYIDKMHKTFTKPPPMYKEVKVISEKIITINGNKGYKAIIDYILNMQGKNFCSRTMETIIIKDSHAYIIIGSAMESNFSKYENIFEEVSGSFKFEKN
jgi:hypothetical protein